MLAVGLLLLAVSSALARKWTDNTGKYSVEAELVSSQGGQVTLRKPDGSVVVLPITRLSEADRRDLESLKKPTPKQSTADVGAEQPSQPTMSGPKLSGKIHGQDFTPDRVDLDLGGSGILTIRQGKDIRPDLAMKIFLFPDDGETPEGKTYNVTAKTGYRSPHIRMLWKEPGKRTGKTEVFMRDYVMKLQIGRASKGKLPGKIDLRLPDEAQSFVAGTFTIVMLDETSEPGTGEISGKITLPASSKDLYIWVGCLGRNPEGKMEGPAPGFKLDGSVDSVMATTLQRRNSVLLRDKKTGILAHKHVNRPPGWYLVYVRGNRRDSPDGRITHEGYYDWKWVEIKEDKLKVTVDLTVDPGNSGTVEVTLSGPTKESSVTYLPLDENGQLPFPDAHSYLQRTSSAKIEGGKAVIRGLREGKYQVAKGPWQGDTRLPSVTADVEVKQGSTTKVVLARPPAAGSQEASSGLPDLEVTDVYLDERGSIKVRIKNNGTAPAIGFSLVFTIDGERENTRSGMRFHPGQEREMSGGGRALSAGTYVVKFALDPENTIRESDETNNSKEVTLLVP